MRPGSRPTPGQHHVPARNRSTKYKGKEKRIKELSIKPKRSNKVKEKLQCPDPTSPTTGNYLSDKHTPDLQRAYEEMKQVSKQSMQELATKLGVIYEEVKEWFVHKHTEENCKRMQLRSHVTDDNKGKSSNETEASEKFTDEVPSRKHKMKRTSSHDDDDTLPTKKLAVQSHVSDDKKEEESDENKEPQKSTEEVHSNASDDEEHKSTDESEGSQNSTGTD